MLSRWGVYDCAILQPGAKGALRVQTSAYQPVEEITLSADEQTMASWVMAHRRTMGLYDDAQKVPAGSTPAQLTQHMIIQSTLKGRAIQHSLHLIPLQMGQKVIG